MGRELLVEIGSYRELVFGRILDMDEADRGTLNFMADSGVRLHSVLCPELCRVPLPILRVWGSCCSDDTRTFSARAASIKEAEYLVARIKRAVREYNAQRAVCTPSDAAHCVKLERVR